MSTAIHNERLKLWANALNSTAVASFTLGVIAPLTAAFYHVQGVGPVPPQTIILGAVIWPVVSGALHKAAKYSLGRLRNDND